MAKIRNTKKCCYMIDDVNLTPEYGEMEVSDKRADELTVLDGIEVVEYDFVEVPVLATSEPVHDVKMPVESPTMPDNMPDNMPDLHRVPAFPDENTRAETPKKRRSKKGKRGK